MVGSAAAPVDRCRNLRRDTFMTYLGRRENYPNFPRAGPERRRPLILPIGMHFPGLCAKMPCGLCSARGLMIMIPAIIVGGHLAVAVADRPPVVNFEQTCREETTGRTNDKFEFCIADEKRARDQLAAQWNSFDPGARARCVRTSTSGHAASYLELLVCLELDQADR